ncbi:MAG: ABC transporter permease [Acidobacteriota bacterium]|nr:ABC transporter permease [Acidobacteriota bacterium]
MARRQALAEFGRTESSQEEYRQAHGAYLLESFLQNLRIGLRMLAKNPGFAAIAILTLALGIGANTAIFTVVDALLLKPLPYAHPSRLVMVYESSVSDRADVGPFSYPRFALLQTQQHAFSGISAYAGDDFAMTGRGEPRQIAAMRVTWNFFNTLGVQPALGRNFLPGEGQRAGNRVVILSHNFWLGEFAGAPGVLGRHLMLDSVSYTIIGVLPADFSFAPAGNDVALWIPREFELNIATPAHIAAGMGYLEAVARLAPGTSLTQAQSQMDVLDRQYQRDNPNRPDADTKFGMTVAPLQSMFVENIRAAVLVLMAAVGLVLLIACANVASLLLSRAVRRRKEIAVRIALGARRADIARQLLGESLLLAAISGVAGIFAGYAGLRALLALNHETVSQFTGAISMDWRVLLFTLAISLASGVLFGLAPALQLSRADLNPVLRDESRGASGSRRAARSQNLLVVAQVALSMILLVGCGLLIRSFTRLLTENPGFDPDRVVTMQMDLPPSEYASHAQMVSFYNELLRQTETIPGVAASAISSALPPTATREGPILAEGEPVVPLAQRPLVTIQTISPGYAKVLRVPLERGREFTADDDQTVPTYAIVNQAFVRRFWPNENPLGKRIWLGSLPKPLEVVGVFGDVKNSGLAAESAPELMLPFPSLPWSHLRLSLRAAGSDPLSLVPAVRARLARIDGNLPIMHVATLNQILANARAQSRFTVALFGIFSAVALVLAIVGIYGVISYAAAQRTHELGIRMALGATRADVLKLVLGHGLALAIVGVAIGLIAPFTLIPLMSSLLYKISPADPLTLISSAILFLLAALAASYFPARRAMRIDPAVALRHE